MRPRHLEVEEELGVDVRELLGAPGAREERGRERRALAAVVPAAEGADEDRAVELRPPLDPKLASAPIKPSYSGRQIVATKTTAAAQTTAASVTCRITRPERQVRPVLDLADDHLDDEQPEQDERAAQMAGCRA